MEEWRSYTTLSSQEKRKDMEYPSDSLRFVSSPRGNELTQKAYEMMTISTLQRKELEKIRNEQNPLGEKEEDWLNTLQHWKSKRNSTLERRKDSSRDHIKSSLSDSIEKGRESGLGSSIFSPTGGSSLISPSSNYVLTNFSPAVQPEKKKEKSELDQVLIQLELLRQKKEKGEQEDIPSRFTPPLSHNVGKSTWTNIQLDMDKKETANVSATLHYSPREKDIITKPEAPQNSLIESKKFDKDVIGNDKRKKPIRMVVDIGIDDPIPPSSSSFSSSHIRSSYRSSTLNPITPPIPQSIFYPPNGDSSFSGSGMRMYGSLPRRKDNDYRVISIDDKKDPGKLTDFVPDVDRRREYENGIMRETRRDQEPILIRNYDVHPVTPIDTRSKFKTIDDFDHRPMKTVDSYSTLPSKWSKPIKTFHNQGGVGRSAQRVEEIIERREREIEMDDGTVHIEIDEIISTEILTPTEWLSITRGNTPGLKKNGGNLVGKEFASELQEKIIKKMETDEKNTKERRRLCEKGMNTVSSRKLCSDCGEQLGNGSAMIIGSIGLSFHIRCFRCSQCGSSLDKRGSEGAQVQLDGGRLKCVICYENSSL